MYSVLMVPDTYLKCGIVILLAAPLEEFENPYSKGTSNSVRNEKKGIQESLIQSLFQETNVPGLSHKFASKK